MLPRQVYIGTAKMPVSCSLLVNRAQQIQRFNNAGRAEREVLFNKFGNFVVGNFAGAESIYQNGNRLCNTNGISKLNFAFIGKACGNNVFSYITCCVSRAAVYFVGSLPEKAPPP